MKASTSGMPHDEEYSFNFGAATELEDQLQRARSILGRLAAGVAGLDPTQPPDLRGLVERQHVLRAAEILFSPDVAGTSLEDLRRKGPGKYVFISYADKDEDCAHELAARLKEVDVSYFVAKETIPAAAEWAVYIWQAIRDCRVFVVLNSAPAKKRDWCKYEIGAALGLKKRVVAVLLDSTGLPQVLKHLQTNFKFRTEDQKGKLVDHLKSLCVSDKKGTA
jgi:TIR domain